MFEVLGRGYNCKWSKCLSSKTESLKKIILLRGSTYCLPRTSKNAALIRRSHGNESSFMVATVDQEIMSSLYKHFHSAEFLLFCYFRDSVCCQKILKLYSESSWILTEIIWFQILNIRSKIILICRSPFSYFFWPFCTTFLFCQKSIFLK